MDIFSMFLAVDFEAWSCSTLLVSWFINFNWRGWEFPFYLVFMEQEFESMTWFFLLLIRWCIFLEFGLCLNYWNVIQRRYLNQCPTTLIEHMQSGFKESQAQVIPFKPEFFLKVSSTWITKFFLPFKVSQNWRREVESESYRNSHCQKNDCETKFD